ncbi:hypothetical protein WICPIJ_002749 [Wickerhamomyces pijperi]|uniref:Mating factor alpha n=1 Tax=Wickerhamomyces pijperi TaxID=599730 RepID=A0A9P8Q8D2_WICPI|nr:hypothetical protein WICPIJ_002749 [Wickerhamomyces pijperi]
MQLSQSTILAIATVLLQSILGAAEDTTTTSSSEETEIEGAQGSVNGTDLPFSDAAVLEAVALPADVYPIITEDSVLFVNKTIAEAELEAKYGSTAEESTSSFAKRQAEADAHWYWHQYRFAQPYTKRDANADAGTSRHSQWIWSQFLRPGQKSPISSSYN